MSRTYGKFKAVDDVTLSVEPGEFLALLGPSGSGKTTILMTIAGFDFPSDGRVLIGGEDITHQAPNRRNLGMVFQKYTLFPHLTVRDNVAFPLKMRGIAKSERRRLADEALKVVRLDGFADRFPSQLSGGQQQRAAIARALIYRPRVLLMDEPLSALDKKLREEMQLEIKSLQIELGITVVFVTHDQDEALTMADRIAVLDHGKVQQLGTPEELYERPANHFVASFMGETNFLPARISQCTENGIVLALANEGTCRVNGGQIVGDCKPGDTGVVGIRPDKIVVSRDAGMAGAMPARFENEIYAGSSVIAQCRLADGTAVRARLSSLSALGEVRRNDPVWLSWADSDARFYREDRQ